VLERWLERPAEAVLDGVRERDALRGRRITWSAGAGIADGIDEEGRLVVRAGDGSALTLDAGEVHLGLSAGADR
jgi:biotin-(acetyl-CoA carboxylase) ligase